jgi:GTP:adenosylcobinamide-phosphate guanylyltransferase
MMHPTENSSAPFSAVLLAADRSAGDPVAAAAGVSGKSFVPVGGKPMVLRVLDALAESQQVGYRLLCGPPADALRRLPELQARIDNVNVGWIENRATPSTSAAYALQTLTDKIPVLVTTADHALLSAEIVDYFCSRARTSGCDVVVGLAAHDLVKAAYPQTRRTATKWRDGAYCSCNLFAFLTPQARVAAEFWREVEHQRKKPLRLIRSLGWMTVLRYLFKQLSLPAGLESISRRLGIKAGAVILPFPEAAVDVDTIEDWKLVQTIVAEQRPDQLAIGRGSHRKT